ncbi:MAG: DUF5615 family PIN-like protein [Candidatus Bipolaricaulia bacterium]
MLASPKLYLDENVHKQVASSLRLRGYSVISAHEEKNWGLSDQEQLEFAINRESAIFTFDPRDFILLHKEYIREGKDHYGIIVSDQITIGKTVNKLSNLLLERTGEDLKSQLLWL